MVNFAYAKSDASSGNSVGDVVLAAIALVEPQLRDLRIHVDLELDPQLPEVSCHCKMHLMVNRLMQTAIARSLEESELQISVCQTIRGIEIEIADGSPTDNLPTNAFSRWSGRQFWEDDAEQLHTNQHIELFHTRCPQGGQAWTLVLVSHKTYLRAAA